MMIGLVMWMKGSLVSALLAGTVEGIELLTIH